MDSQIHDMALIEGNIENNSISQGTKCAFDDATSLTNLVSGCQDIGGQVLVLERDSLVSLIAKLQCALRRMDDPDTVLPDFVM